MAECVSSHIDFAVLLKQFVLVASGGICSGPTEEDIGVYTINPLNTLTTSTRSPLRRFCTDDTNFVVWRCTFSTACASHFKWGCHILGADMPYPDIIWAVRMWL